MEANTDVIHNQRQKTLKVASVLLFLHILSTKLVHRKGWGMCRSPKSYNLSLDCSPCLVLFKMADKISMSQRALPKVTSQRYISSQRYIPNNVTLKKRQKPSAFYDRCQPSAGPRLIAPTATLDIFSHRTFEK